MIAAIYARKSTEQTGVADDQKSVARQIEHARAYALKKGWTVADEHLYSDDGISGAEFANRPGYMRLLNALKPRAPFQVLIVAELSRLGREQLETGYAFKQLSQAAVRIFSDLEDREVLLDSATDKFLLSAVNFAAESSARRRDSGPTTPWFAKRTPATSPGAGCLGTSTSGSPHTSSGRSTSGKRRSSGGS